MTYEDVLKLFEKGCEKCTENKCDDCIDGMIKKVLSKQIPKVCILDSYGDLCPVCKEHVGKGGRFGYCKKCGQHIY